MSETVYNSNQQIVEYTTTDPITDEVVPLDQDAPAVAVRKGGGGDMYQWDHDKHEWIPK